MDSKRSIGNAFEKNCYILPIMTPRPPKSLSIQSIIYKCIYFIYNACYEVTLVYMKRFRKELNSFANFICHFVLKCQLFTNLK